MYAKRPARAKESRVSSRARVGRAGSAGTSPRTGEPDGAADRSVARVVQAGVEETVRCKAVSWTREDKKSRRRTHASKKMGKFLAARACNRQQAAQSSESGTVQLTSRVLL